MVKIRFINLIDETIIQTVEADTCIIQKGSILFLQRYGEQEVFDDYWVDNINYSIATDPGSSHIQIALVYVKPMSKKIQKPIALYDC